MINDNNKIKSTDVAILPIHNAVFKSNVTANLLIIYF